MSTATERSTARVIGIVPQLLVDDLDRAIAYYRDKLGFAVEFTYESFYASVWRDGCSIHLKHGPRLAGEKEFRKEHEHLDAHIAVSGIQDLYNEIQRRGADVVRPLEERPWNCRDFYVEDADGYLVCFSERIG